MLISLLLSPELALSLEAEEHLQSWPGREGEEENCPTADVGLNFAISGLRTEKDFFALFLPSINRTTFNFAYVAMKSGTSFQ